MTEPRVAPPDTDEITALYRLRFDDAERRAKRALWDVLCRNFFQRYVGEGDAVVDLGAGTCEFSNAIRARRRIAVDLNPETVAAAHPGVEVLTTSADDLQAIGDGEIDVVFSSNFLEHLPSKAVLLAVLREARRVLRPGGRLIVLMPNLRYLAGAYWDYFDHHLPLTDRSLVEAIELARLRPERVIPRFLPYTVKGRLPAKPWMVRVYLRVRPAWRVFGRQMLVTAIRPEER